MTFHLFSRNFCEILEGHFSAGEVFGDVTVTFVAPRIVNNVSYVTRINHESHFAWQAQYSVMLEDDTCCSAHCN